MVAVVDELQLTELVTSIVGLSAVGGVTILAETGDLTRVASARAVVKHSGLAPREKSSGTYTGRTKLTGQGRPGLRRAPGGRSGELNAPTSSIPPSSPPNQPVRTSSIVGKPTRRSPPRCCANCTRW
jgi:Transposase IS116/IS110/IS902 family